MKWNKKEEANKIAPTVYSTVTRWNTVHVSEANRTNSFFLFATAQPL